MISVQINDDLNRAVRSFGTEDRPTDRPVAPRDEVYEYIIFRGADIKDIRVCEPPKPQATLQGGLPNDPAIVKVRRKFLSNNFYLTFYPFLALDFRCSWRSHWV